MKTFHSVLVQVGKPKILDYCSKKVPNYNYVLEQGEDYIYVADMGNNDYDRTEFYIYRFKEPLIK